MEAGLKPIRVLFLCTGNSARSIMGAALLKRAGGDAFEVHSAGTEPKGINPYTVRVLDQAGIDSSDARSKSVVEYEGEPFDYVITVCDAAAERCPIFPGAPERIHWSFADPAAVAGGDGERLAAFQRTLREMEERITTFVPVALRAKARVLNAD